MTTITDSEAMALAQVVLSCEEDARSIARTIRERERSGNFEPRLIDADKTVDLAVTTALRLSKGRRVCL